MPDSVFKKKQQLIKKITQDLDNTFADSGRDLYKQILQKFIDQLSTDGKDIKNTAANINLISKIDALYTDFIAIVSPGISQQILEGSANINSLNIDYFKSFAKNEKKLKASAAKVRNLTLDRLGFGEKTKLKPGGFMDSLFKDTTVLNEVKRRSLQQVVKGTGFQALKQNLQDYILGDKEKLGAFQQHHRNFSYDIFVNVDRGESKQLADSLNMKAFYYEGTIIETSRQFCIERAGKLFTIAETKAWANDPWIKKALEKGYIASYDPVNDLGLWGCRHLARFVPDEVAISVRPELKGKL